MSTSLDATAPTKGRLGSAVQRAHGSITTYLGVGGVLVVTSAVLALTQPAFATAGNLVGILDTNAFLLVVAVGLTFVLLVGGFDLSVGGMLALCGVVLGLLVEAGVNPLVAIAVVLAGGTVLGLVTNGLLIGRIGLSFFVVTLGTMSIFRGAAQLLTDGSSIGLYGVPQVTWIGSGVLLGIPVSVWICLGVFTAGLIVTRYTGFGRMLYAVGGNAEAARLAGINVRAVRVAAYTICASLAALAGVMMTGRPAGLGLADRRDRDRADCRGSGAPGRHQLRGRTGRHVRHAARRPVPRGAGQRPHHQPGLVVLAGRGVGRRAHHRGPARLAAHPSRGTRSMVTAPLLERGIAADCPGRGLLRRRPSRPVSSHSTASR